MSKKTVLPKIRTENLVTKELANEVLLYDIDRHTAFCLNAPARLIMQHCDGRTSAETAIRAMTKTLGSELSEELLWSTVEELRMANLLYDAKVPPFFQGGLSRRKMIRNAVALGMAAPVISAIAVPTAGATQSCLPSNATCSQSAPPACCPGLTCFFTEGGPTGFQCT